MEETLAPDLSNEFGNTLQNFKIVILYKKTPIVELRTTAQSTQDLREQYIKMLTGMSLKEGVTIQVYKQVDNEWHIVEEHLF